MLTERLIHKRLNASQHISHFHEILKVNLYHLNNGIQNKIILCPVKALRDL